MILFIELLVGLVAVALGLYFGGPQAIYLVARYLNHRRHVASLAATERLERDLGMAPPRPADVFHNEVTKALMESMTQPIVGGAGATVAVVTPYYRLGSVQIFGEAFENTLLEVGPDALRAGRVSPERLIEDWNAGRIENDLTEEELQELRRVLPLDPSNRSTA